jgi:hypothetical protein
MSNCKFCSSLNLPCHVKHTAIPSHARCDLFHVIHNNSGYRMSVRKGVRERLIEIYPIHSLYLHFQVYLISHIGIFQGCVWLQKQLNCISSSIIQQFSDEVTSGICSKVLSGEIKWIKDIVTDERLLQHDGIGYYNMNNWRTVKLLLSTKRSNISQTRNFVPTWLPS